MQKSASRVLIVAACRVRRWVALSRAVSAVGCEHGGMELPDTRKQWNANAAAWTELSRAGFDVYRDLVNTPAFFALLPPVNGVWCLDLGCGEGHNTRLLADRGAHVVALDVVEAFIRSAVGDEPRPIP